jgi:hypothetical protein
MKLHIPTVVATLATAFVVACAQLGMAPVDTFNKKLAAGYATVDAIAQGATALVQSGKLNSTDQANVVATAKAGVQGLDLARSMYTQSCPPGTPPTCAAPNATTKLEATIAVLTAMQAYLATKGN